MRLEEPFDVDDGELDGLTPQQCFTLGVEWSNIRAAADSDRLDDPFLIHELNVPRIKAIARRRKDLILYVQRIEHGWAWITFDRMPAV